MPVIATSLQAAPFMPAATGAIYYARSDLLSDLGLGTIDTNNVVSESNAISADTQLSDLLESIIPINNDVVCSAEDGWFSTFRCIMLSSALILLS